MYPKGYTFRLFPILRPCWMTFLSILTEFDNSIL